MIIVGFELPGKIPVPNYRDGGSGPLVSHIYVGIICNHENGILIRDKFNHYIHIDSTGYGDYVLMEMCHLKHSGLTPKYIIYDPSLKGMSNIKDEYNCEKIEASIRCKFDIYYTLSKHIPEQSTVYDHQRIMELETKVESLTNQLTQINLTNPSINSINQTLATKVNELQAENEELKRKLQQIIDLAL